MDRCTATCLNGAQGSPSIFCGGAADWDPKTFRGRCIQGPGGCGQLMKCAREGVWGRGGAEIVLCRERCAASNKQSQHKGQIVT